MKIKLLHTCKLLGTDITFYGGRTYKATIATNQPYYKENDLVFVENAKGESMLLQGTQYIVIDDNKVETYRDNIKRALQSINRNYGRGDIKFWGLELNGNGFVLIDKQYGSEKAKFHLKGNSVYFRGHQMIYRW